MRPGQIEDRIEKERGWKLSCRGYISIAFLAIHKLLVSNLCQKNVLFYLGIIGIDIIGIIRYYLALTFNYHKLFV